MNPTPDRAPKEEIGQFISEWLASHNMHRSDLARALGTTRAAVSGWTRGIYYPDVGLLYQAALNKSGDLCTLAKDLLRLMGHTFADNASLDCSSDKSD